jgi:Steigviridae/Suoliviridae L,D-carboxypeptidase/transpeptidase
MKLLLQREQSTDSSTPGILYVNGIRECYTLEDIVRELPLVPIAEWKVQNKTAIPAGIFHVIIDESQRFGRKMPHVIDMPRQSLLNAAAALLNQLAGFLGIRIHSGNIAADTDGCILVGRIRNGWNTILESRVAFGQLFGKLETAFNAGEEITLQIVNAAPAPKVGLA